MIQFSCLQYFLDCIECRRNLNFYQLKDFVVYVLTTLSLSASQVQNRGNKILNILDS